jgi:cytochrome c-type biogenesis protein CcmH
VTKTLLTIVIISIIIQLFLNNSYAVEPEEFLQNPKQEMRARDISKNIRCLVCQNQSIDDSAAPLAKDLRALIRIKVQENDTDEEIYKFLTDRYGDFILLKPPFKISTFLLWSLPFVFFIIGIFILFLHNKKSKKTFGKFNVLLIFLFFSI